MSLFPSSLIIAASPAESHKKIIEILNSLGHSWENNPDLFIFQKMNIDEVRECQNFLSKKAYSHDSKIIAIPNAQELNLESQNALLKTLEESCHTQLYAYHVVLLRQVLENVASFLGVGRISYALEHIGVEDVEGTVNTINSLSHKDVYYYQSDLMSPSVEVVFRDVFNKLLAKYPFVLHAG